MVVFAPSGWWLSIVSIFQTSKITSKQQELEALSQLCQRSTSHRSPGLLVLCHVLSTFWISFLQPPSLLLQQMHPCAFRCKACQLFSQPVVWILLGGSACLSFLNLSRGDKSNHKIILFLNKRFLWKPVNNLQHTRYHDGWRSILKQNDRN